MIETPYFELPDERATTHHRPGWHFVVCTLLLGTLLCTGFFLSHPAIGHGSSEQLAAQTQPHLRTTLASPNGTHHHPAISLSANSQPVDKGLSILGSIDQLLGDACTFFREFWWVIGLFGGGSILLRQLQDFQPGKARLEELSAVYEDLRANPDDVTVRTQAKLLLNKAPTTSRLEDTILSYVNPELSSVRAHVQTALASERPKLIVIKSALEEAREKAPMKVTDMEKITDDIDETTKDMEKKGLVKISHSTSDDHYAVCDEENVEKVMRAVLKQWIAQGVYLPGDDTEKQVEALVQQVVLTDTVRVSVVDAYVDNVQGFLYNKATEKRAAYFNFASQKQPLSDKKRILLMTCTCHREQLLSNYWPGWWNVSWDLQAAVNMRDNLQIRERIKNIRFLEKRMAALQDEESSA